MPDLTSEYQKKVQESLNEILQGITDVEVKREHSSKIDKRNKIYSPRMDLLIFPEAEEEGTKIYNKCISLKEDTKVKEFIRKILEKSMNKDKREDWGEYNTNPRYFIGIEIENATSKNFKHVLGSMANLSALCFFGILVFYTSEDKIIKRLERYMSFVYEKKKLTIPLFPNVFILKRSDFEEVVPVD